MQAVVTEEPPPPGRAGPLTPVITALLRKDPEDRPSAAEAERMLLDAMEGREPQAAQAFVPTQRVPDEALRTLGDDGASGAGATGTAELPHTAAGSPADPVPSPVTRRSGGRWRTTVLVIAAAALVGGGAGFAMIQFGDSAAERGGTGTHATDSPESPGTSHPAEPGTSGEDIPKGWHRVDDPEGFSLIVPDGWERRADGNQVDYTPDNGVHYIRISIDPAPDFENSYMHMLNMEEQLSQRLPAYQRQTLHSNTYRDRQGSLWEFTWTETKDHPGERHAIDQMYYEGMGGPEYALYMSGPASDWDTTREQFDTMLRGWRAPDSSD
jgi:hypothetical protein